GNTEPGGAVRALLHLVHGVAQARELLAQLAHRRHHPDHRLAHTFLVALAFEELVQLAQGMPRRRGDGTGLGDLEREHRLAPRLEGGRIALVEIRPVVEIELVSLVGCVVHACLRVLRRLTAAGLRRHRPARWAARPLVPRPRPLVGLSTGASNPAVTDSAPWPRPGCRERGGGRVRCAPAPRAARTSGAEALAKEQAVERPADEAVDDGRHDGPAEAGDVE